MYSDSTIFGLLVVYVIIFVLYVFGYITMIIALTHSHKKRVVRGEDYSAVNVFLWLIGWNLVMSCTFGFATIIYFLVKRNDIKQTKLQHSQVLANVRSMHMQPISQ